MYFHGTTPELPQTFTISSMLLHQISKDLHHLSTDLHWIASDLHLGADRVDTGLGVKMWL
jgi:hypothetical protein